ncbi:MAG: hypothetical protein JWP00_2745 [Chloroflexi bacterium]|nr:hypothetical protein [Chloroflexota bacterium]
MADANQLARQAVERLSEDEALRGDLSDFGFGPLLDWANAAVEAYAAKEPDSAAMDQYTSRVRGVVQSAVDTAQAGKLDDPEALLDFDPPGRDKALADLKALQLGDDPDDNAVKIAAVLQSAMTSTPGASPEAAPAAEPAKEVNPPAEEFNPVAGAIGAALEAAVKAANSALKAVDGPGTTQDQAPLPQPEPKPESSAKPASDAPGPAPAANRSGAFISGVKSKVGRAYTSARGLLRGKGRRRKE